MTISLLAWPLVLRETHLFLMGQTQHPEDHETLSTRCHACFPTIQISLLPQAPQALVL